MSHHYILSGETREYQGITLYRIQATHDLPTFNVKAGEFGGWVESTTNLEGGAWVSGDATVFGNAVVFGEAWVSGEAEVRENAQVYSAARVSGRAQIYDSAEVAGHGEVSGDAWVSGTARVFGNARISGDAWVYGDAEVRDRAAVYGNTEVSGHAKVFGDVEVTDDAEIAGEAEIYGDAEVYGKAKIELRAKVASNQDYLHVLHLGPESHAVTCYRSENTTYVRVGDWLGALADLEGERGHGLGGGEGADAAGALQNIEYKHVLGMCQAREKLWELEEAKPPSMMGVCPLDRAR